MSRDSERQPPRTPPSIHRGSDHSSPYPVSRLAPAFDLVDIAREIQVADRMINGRLGGQLEVIAEQVRSLQAQARRILERAREDQRLHRARCTFQRRPGHTYHLYEDADGGCSFSMLSPDDWRGRPPKPYIGAYRLENDMGWTALDGVQPEYDGRALVARLLSVDPAGDG
jgi:hypothetical protein